MQHAGMTETLAQGLADATGRFFPVVSPWIGALGAFMTGSNTNSNVVFSALQMRTAELLGYSCGDHSCCPNRWRRARFGDRPYQGGRGCFNRWHGWP